MSVGQVLWVTRFEVSRKLVSWRFPIAVVAAAVVLVLAYNNGMSAMAEGWSSVPAYDLLRPFVASASMVIAISAVIMTSESLTEEFESGSGYIMFTRSVGRGTFYAGKFMGSFTVSMLVLLIYYLVTFAICIGEVGYLPPGNIEGFLLALLFLFTVTAACMVFSAVSPRGSMSMIVSFALMVVVPIFLQNVSFDVEPWYSLGYAAGAIGDVALGNTAVYGIADGSVVTDRFFPDPVVSAVVFASYGIISVLISQLVLRYRSW